MSVDMTAPEWMHSQITAAEYESWSEEQCTGIEIVDGMVVASPSASKRHNRLTRILANALDAAARLCEQALPGQRGIHRTRQGRRALPGRDRPVGSLVMVRATA
jgi:hypothetical protein